MCYEYTVTIKDPARRATWFVYLGTDTLPIVSPFPTRANVPGHPDALVYLVDFEALDTEAQDCLVLMLGDDFGIPYQEVRGELAAWPRVPVLAEGTIIDVYEKESEDCHE